MEKIKNEKDKTSRENIKVLHLISRYIILLLLGAFNLAIFYKIFTPLTIYPDYFLFKLFFSNAFLEGNSIYFSSITLKIIPSCIAGAAYYLLSILNLTTPMPLLKRILSLLFSYIMLLILNIFRIFIFAVFFIKSFYFFNIGHFIFWYFLSTLFVFFIWVLTIKYFKIENIPLYTDFKFLYRAITARKKLN